MSNEWHILTVVCSLLALFVPSTSAILLQRRKLITKNQSLLGLFLYSVVFSLMFYLGTIVSYKLVEPLTSAIYISMGILAVMSFKTFYVYVRPRNLWVKVEVSTMEQFFWVAFAMSFDWFITGMGLGYFLMHSWYVVVLLFILLFLLLGLMYFYTFSEVWFRRAEKLFPYTYLFASTLYIFAMLFIMIDILW
ncbi:MAG: hypothetical protein N2Z72_08925 [Bacteroidales bacterium]|nr:hypothetical protein [Bacteroidales bacterium]